MVNIRRSLKCIRARKYANERNTIYLYIRERHVCHHATQARLVSTKRTSIYVYTTAWNLFVHNIVKDKYPHLYVYYRVVVLVEKFICISVTRRPKDSGVYSG